MIKKRNKLVILIEICILIFIIFKTFIVIEVMKYKGEIIINENGKFIGFSNETTFIKSINYNVGDYIQQREINGGYTISYGDDNNYIFTNECNITININDFDEKNNYEVVYGEKESLKKETITSKQTQIKLELKENIENNITVKIVENGETIKEENKTIYVVIPYKQQFLQELSNRGVGTQFRPKVYEIEYKKSIDLISKLGVNLIRNDYKWDTLKTASGRDNYLDYYDGWTQYAKENNLKIYGVISGQGDFLGEDKLISSDEEKESLKQFFDFVKSRYGKSIDYLEILNEPNNSNSLKEKEIELYSELYCEINKENNGFEIVSGSASTFIQENESITTIMDFYNKLHNNEINNTTIPFSYHLYDTENRNNEGFEEKLNTMNELFSKNGGFEKKYVSEYGIANYNNNNYTEEEQANMIIQQTVLLDENKSDITILFTFYNYSDDKNTRSFNFGLINNDYSPKKSYYAMKKFYENTNGSEYIGEAYIADGVSAHVYDKDGKIKIIAWSTDASNSLKIDYSNYTATDLYGNNIENTDGTLTITDSPIYIDNADNKYFYQAISNTAIQEYTNFETNNAEQIAKVSGLKEKIESLKSYMKSLATNGSENESIALSKFNEHFELGNIIIDAYRNKSLDVEDVKLSSMLDSINTIGNSFEDLITITAKTRIQANELEDINNTINNSQKIINKNIKVEIVFPNKILQFSKDLYETAAYINGLEEENDIKTGLINSKALHSKKLAEWSEKFADIYYDDINKNVIYKIITANQTLQSSNPSVYSNITVLTNYNELIESLNKLVKEPTSASKDTIIDCYKKQYMLILAIANETTDGNIKLTNDELNSLLLSIDGITEDYKDAFSYYVNENETDTKEMMNKLNDTINYYNSNTDIDIIKASKLIERAKDVYNNNEMDSSETYLNELHKHQISYLSEIANQIILKEVNKAVDSEKNILRISYSDDINTLINKSITTTLRHGPSTIITNNDGQDDHIFDDNGTFAYEINIKGATYQIPVTINNIDKKEPSIIGIEENAAYLNTVTPLIEDENIESIEAVYNGTIIDNYKSGVELTDPGSYTITAIDKAKNKTIKHFTIYNLSDNNYKQDGEFITNISKKTAASLLKDKLGIKTDYQVTHNERVLNLSTDRISTGDILKAQNQTYTLIVTADIDSDGDVTVKDLVKYREFLIDQATLTKAEAKAADASFDGELSIKDLIAIRNILIQ